MEYKNPVKNLIAVDSLANKHLMKHLLLYMKSTAHIVYIIYTFPTETQLNSSASF